MTAPSDPAMRRRLSPLVLALAACPGAAQIRKVGDTLVDAQARTILGGFGQAINGKSFQQDALLTHRGRQYVAYYDARGHVCVARRTLPGGAFAVVRLSDYTFKSDDAHNTISMGICPGDDTVHLAWDHHVHPLHYRRSRKGAAAGDAWSAELFGEVQGELEAGQPVTITYPRFWPTPDGGLQFCYRRGRSGSGDRMLVDYDPETGTWSGTRPIDAGRGRFADADGASTSRCSYPNGYDYGPDGRLHVTWVWRESSAGANHDLMYAYSQDRGRTWNNTRGEPLAAPPWIGSPGIVVAPISRRLGLMNTHGQVVDAAGRVHVVVWHCTNASLEKSLTIPGEFRWGPPEARRYHHYWRDTDGTWSHVELPGIAGKRPKVFAGPGDDLWLITSDAHSKPIDRARGNLVIMTATQKARWRDWRVVHRERGPFVNEMLGDRPRFAGERVLSVMVQELPEKPRAPTRLRVLDFALGR